MALAGLEVAVAAEQVGLGVVQEDAEAGPALAVVGALEGLEAAWVDTEVRLVLPRQLQLSQWLASLSTVQALDEH